MTTPWRHLSRPRKFVRDYHRPRYGNPLFPNAGGRQLRHGGRQTKRGGRGTPKGPIAMVLCVAAIIGALWYVIWSPAFMAASFDIQGASPSTEDAVRAALDGYADAHALLILPRRNIFLFSAAAAKAAVEKAVFLDAVEIRKKLPGTVVVTIREKTAKAVLERAGQLYALDESGFVIRELSGRELALMGDLPPGMASVPVQGLGAESVDVPAAATGSVPNEAPAKKPNAAKDAAAAGQTNDAKQPKNVLPLILDRRTEDPHKDVRRPGAQAFSAATVTLILQANSRLPDVTGEAIRWYTPDETSDSVDATMAGDWHIYLATATPFDIQAERLALVLRDKIGSKRPSLEYVDLRYNERIFYRLKDAAP